MRGASPLLSKACQQIITFVLSVHAQRLIVPARRQRAVTLTLTLSEEAEIHTERPVYRRSNAIQSVCCTAV